MASEAQTAANQANAQLSTGPRTEAGKARSAQNHTRHGLCSREFVVLPGQQEEFDAFMTELRDGIKPSGPVESDLFTQLAHASWTLRRCRRADADLQSYHRPDPDKDPMLVPHFSEQRRTIDLYTRRAERSYHKALKELKALQNGRQVDDLAEALPLSDRRDLQKQRMLLAKAKSALRQAEMIRNHEAFTAPPPPLPSKSFEHSNPIPFARQAPRE